MTKADLIAQVAKEAKITKSEAGKAVDSITDTVGKDLKKGGRTTLTGFGTFSVANRNAPGPAETRERGRRCGSRQKRPRSSQQARPSRRR